MPHQPDHDPTPSKALAAVVDARAHVAVYDQTYLEPVRRLNETLSDVLDVDAHPERDPETALALVKDAVDRFAVDSDGWLG